MGRRLRARTDYENLRNTRISKNQAQLGSLEKENAKKNKKMDMSPARTGTRRSSRLEGKSYNFTPDCAVSNQFSFQNGSAGGVLEERQQVCGEKDDEQSSVLDSDLEDRDDVEESQDDKDDVGEENDYETLRKLRISENQARLASLGVLKTVSELRSIASPSRNERSVRKWIKVDYSSATLRRSGRLKGMPCNLLSSQGESDFEESDVENKKRRKYNRLASECSAEAMARRCASKGRGGVYDGVYGICCHSCRQKKLCGEEDCKHCGNLDIKEPCIGKTECSVCHSSNGVFCRACLYVRYGEEMDDVRENKQWMCPHCVEDKGIRPHWICNSSICLNKRKMVPTGIAIYKAREMGYESVAHLLMEELQKAGKGGEQAR